MKNIILTIIIGLVAGLVDVMPMIKMKMDKFAISSAFVFYFIAPIFIFSSTLFDMDWWLKGAVITLLMAIPNILIIVKTEKKAVPAIIASAVIIGTLISTAGHFLKVTL